jgi:Uma2 family endonuclease
VWQSLTSAERAVLVESLPSEFPLAGPPEGDPHRLPKQRALEALSEHFRRIKRRVYLSSELPVYYPGERLFAPDVIAVLDVEPGPRDRWVVSAEGKGLDFVLEIAVRGDTKKDLVTNVQRYARMGIPEYFAYEPLTPRLTGYRLDSSGAYVRIVPQLGRWDSEVLGLGLSLEVGRLRFLSGSAPLPEAEELIARMGQMVDTIVEREQNLLAELAQERDAAQRERDTAQRALDRAERLLAQLRAAGITPQGEDE